MHHDPEYFFSCDWGTSNFRLRLVQYSSASVIREVRSSRGIRDLYEAHRGISPLDRRDHYLQYLASEINRFPAKYCQCPVIISGMASSSIGLQELAYASCPFGFDGQELNTAKLDCNYLSHVVLTSGVRSGDQMMRGEEIQALGLTEIISQYDEGVLLLPGTHSKHIYFQDRQFTDLRSFMTGELFDIIGEHSTLSDSVRPGPYTMSLSSPFQEGLSSGFRGKLIEEVLKIRANDVLFDKAKDANYYQLSGLLIGAELQALPRTHAIKILAAASPLDKLYREALTTFYPKHELLILDSDTVDSAVISGHKKILHEIGSN